MSKLTTELKPRIPMIARTLLSMNEAEFQALLFEKIQSFTDRRIALKAEEKLFSTGLIDSMTIVEIIVVVEQFWNIEVDPTELSMDNFDSVAAITRYVGRKLGGET